MKSRLGVVATLLFLMVGGRVITSYGANVDWGLLTRTFAGRGGALVKADNVVVRDQLLDQSVSTIRLEHM